MTEQLEVVRRVEAAVAGHDAHVRAATWLVCNSALKWKIGPYVDGDGWIEWDRLTGDLAARLPWSGGELRLARLACSLSGQMPFDLTDRVRRWTLAEVLSGLDDVNGAAALTAITWAATGVRAWPGAWPPAREATR